MSYVPFDSLPDDSCLWIFPSSSSLTPSQQETLGASLQDALTEWNTHGAPVQWGYRFVRDQFLLISINEKTTALSGCSIDTATRAVKGIEQECGLVLTDSHRVFYRKGDDVVVTSRLEFGQRVERGEVSLDTIVFDTVTPTLGDYRSGSWELPARNSWHADAFPFEVTA